MPQSNPMMPRRVILITGYSRGIGRAFVEEHRRRFPEDALLCLGRQRPSHEGEACRWVCADLSRPITVETRSEISSCLRSLCRAAVDTGPSAPDLGDEADRPDVAANLEYLDGFFHAAGLVGPLGAIPLDHVAAREAFQVNLHAFSEVIAAVEPALKKAGMIRRASASVPFVCHLSSGAARSPYGDLPVYCASKAAVLMFAQCLAASLSADELQVLSIAPGTVSTDMTRQLVATSPEEWPGLQKFRDLSASGGYSEPAAVAKTLGDLLFDPRMERKRRQIHGRYYDLRKPDSVDS